MVCPNNITAHGALTLSLASQEESELFLLSFDNLPVHDESVGDGNESYESSIDVLGRRGLYSGRLCFVDRREPSFWHISTTLSPAAAITCLLD
jgi:hypothetical protein